MPSPEPPVRWINPFLHMPRCTPEPNRHSGMLDASARIKKQSADGANAVLPRMPHHSRQPGLFDRLHVIVEEAQEFTACDGRRRIVESREVEWPGIAEHLRPIILLDLDNQAQSS